MDTFHSIRGQGFSFYARACAHAFGEFKTVSILMSVFMLSVCPAFALNASLQHSAANISDTKLEICLPAIAQLGRSHDGEAAGILETAFAQETRPVIKRAIVGALGQLRSPTSVSTLTQALRDTDAQLRQSAVVALEMVGGPDAENILLNHSDIENNFGVKAQLIGAFSRSKNPKAVTKLKTLTQDEDAAIQKLAQKAIGIREKKK